MAYASKDELRTQINKAGTSGSGSDTNLDILIDAVSDLLDKFFNRPDGFIADAAASARYFAGNGKPYILIDECVEISEVAVKDSPSDTTYTAWDSPTTNLAGDGDWLAFRGDVESPDFNNLPYTGVMIDPNGDYSVFTTGRYTTRGGFRPSTSIHRGLPTVKVTSKWGYSVAAPAVIKQATLALSARWFKQSEGLWSDTLASPEFGQMLYRRENADIKSMLMSARLYKPAIGRR